MLRPCGKSYPKHKEYLKDYLETVDIKDDFSLSVYQQGDERGFNVFVMTPKRWIEGTNAIGVVSKSGRYGGTCAHIDIF